MQFSNGQLYEGDCKNVLSEIKSDSVDLICTDPPYGYAFMNKDWDKAVVDIETWQECLRVLKPGAFAFVMSAPRQDVLSRMIVNLSDAGFQTGFTSMYWAYASGFPKAGNISKLVDKKLGKQRETIGIKKHSTNFDKAIKSETGYFQDKANQNNTKLFGYGEEKITLPFSEQAKKLDGSFAGFQPKPAVEVILVCMKPLSEKNYTEQAMKNGKGIVWFDDCRIPTNPEIDDKRLGGNGSWDTSKAAENIYDGGYVGKNISSSEKGRFPANLLVSDDVLNDNINHKSGNTNPEKHQRNKTQRSHIYGQYEDKDGFMGYEKYNSSEGSFSRYFDLDAWDDSNKAQFIITPKASKSEKNKGLENFTPKPKCEIDKMGGAKCTMKTGSGNERNVHYLNNHPTVKPIKLFKYLVTLGSRENDIILDPFIGSGTTALACNEIHRKWIGIEKNPEYIEICKSRLSDITLDIFN